MAHRAARAETEPRLQIEPINLIDDTVNVVVELSALKANGTVMRKQFICTVKPLRQRIDRETPFAKTSTIPVCVSAGMSDISPQA